MKNFWYYGLTVLIGSAAMYLIVIGLLADNLNDRGLFGDMFGGLNALFSGLAFLGLIYTILLQKEELSLQREELKATREELAKAAEAQAEQVNSLRIAAKINGKSAVLEYYGARLQARPNSFEAPAIRQGSESVRREIEDLVSLV